MNSEWKAPEHSGVESYATNPGQVDEASGNIRGPRHVEQAREGAPRNPVRPMPAIPVDEHGRLMIPDPRPPITQAPALFASNVMKDFKG